MQLHDPLLQLPGLVWGEAELTDIVTYMLLSIVVAELSLHGIGAQQSMRDKGAGQPARDDISSQLQAQVVPGDRAEKLWAQAWASRSPQVQLGYGNQTDQHTARQKWMPLDTGIL